MLTQLRWLALSNHLSWYTRGLIKQRSGDNTGIRPARLASEPLVSSPSPKAGASGWHIADRAPVPLPTPATEVTGVGLRPTLSFHYRKVLDFLQ